MSALYIHPQGADWLLTDHRHLRILYSDQMQALGYAMWRLKVGGGRVWLMSRAGGLAFCERVDAGRV